MPKDGLAWNDVSADHFSSGKRKELDYSRFVIRIIEGKSLLASDLDTGKSDPVCFVWIGGKEEKQPPWETITELNAHDFRVLMTTVRPTTCDPKWNEDLVFPLEVTDITHLENLKCVIYVRDEDRNENDVASYDELGLIEFNLDEVIGEGKGLQTSIIKKPSWYMLKKSPGMRRVDGSIKLTVSLIFGPNDINAITEQLETEKKDSPPNTTLGRLLLRRLNGKKFESSTMSKSSALASPSGRPSSASSFREKKKKDLSRPTTAPLFKTSSIMSESDNSILEESDEIVANSKDEVGMRPELSVVKEDDVEDLISEPGYDKVISQIEQHGKKMEQIVHQPVIKEEFDEELNHEKENEQIMELKKNSHSPETFHEMNEHFEFEHHLQKGDENVLEEIVKVGVDAITTAINNFEYPDELNEHVKDVGQAVISVAKKGAEKSKIKLMEVSSISGPPLKSYKDSVISSLDRVQDKLGLGGSSGGGKVGGIKGSQTASTSNLFAHVPGGGDHLENLPDEGNEISGHLVTNQSLHGSMENPEVMHELQRDNNVARPTYTDQRVVQRRPSTRSETAEFPFTEDSVGAFQGSATAVVRILKELHAQRQFMQSTVILLAKANEKGFKHLSGRLSRLEQNLAKINEQKSKPEADENDDDFAFRAIADEAFPDEEPPASLYQEGMKVEVNYRGRGKYFVGSIVRDRGDGTYDIEFDDGEKETKVKEVLIRMNGENPTEAQLSKTVPAPRSRKFKKVKSFNKTTPNPPSQIANKKDYSGFREFRKAIKKQQTEKFPVDKTDDALVPDKKVRQPEIQFVYKDEKGAVTAAKVASSPVDFARQTNENGGQLESSNNEKRTVDDPLLMGPQLADQALPDSPTFRSNNFRNSGKFSQRPATQNRMSGNSLKNQMPISPAKSALNRDFCDVLDRGTIDDVAQLLESSGTQPEQLSISTRNRLYDVVSTLLMQGRNIERCLAWVLAMTRGKANLMRELTVHTQKDLVDSLKKVSREPSKRGMLATLLVSQISRQQSF